MHNLVVGLVFVAIVFTPALVDIAVSEYEIWPRLKTKIRNNILRRNAEEHHDLPE